MHTDRVTFSFSVGILALVCLPIALFPETAGGVVEAVYAWLARTLGFVYLWAVFAALVFLAWLALGKHGKLRLGGDVPDFSTFSWVAMMFTAGTGGGLLYWAAIEWASYVQTPPFGIEAHSSSAYEWAATYGIFHWGVSAWGIYAFPAVAIAVPFYALRLDHLRLSTGLHALLGARGPDSWPGRLTDLIFMVALIGGTGTSLGLSTPMISACASLLFDLEHTFALDASVTGLCAVLFGASVYRGLEGGIRRMSDLNAWVALAFLGLIVAVGPTLFILKTGTNSIGLVLQNSLRMSLYTDPIAATGFVEDWTVFYWAWWIAYAPFFGLFLTRISRGRTVRQLIFGTMFLGTAGCALFFTVLGNYSMWLQRSGGLDVLGVMEDRGPHAAIAESIATLPLPGLALAVFAAVALISVATTYDSASYSLAAASTRGLTEGNHPARWHRVFWAFTLAVLPVTLMFVGGRSGLQAAVLVVSLPLLFVGALLAVSLLRTLRSLDSEPTSSAR